MKIDYVDGKEYWTVESIADFRGWRIIEAEDWKDGVKRLHLMTSDPPELRLAYCPTGIWEAERANQREEFNRQAERMGITLRAV